MRGLRFMIAALCAILASAGNVAFAQGAWPTKPITMIVPYLAGGGADPAARLLAVPAVPITPLFPFAGALGLLPLPVRYRIHFGRPMYFTGDPHEEESSLLEKVNAVKTAIQDMLDRGVAEREHIFW